jgi:hypothetical protein
MDNTSDLHRKLLREISAGGLSILNPYNKRSDPLVLKSVNDVMAYESVQNLKGGPSARRERFTSRYWRKWQNDLNILENESSKITQKQILYKKKSSKRNFLVEPFSKNTIAYSFGNIVSSEMKYDPTPIPKIITRENSSKRSSSNLVDKVDSRPFSKSSNLQTIGTVLQN